MRAGSTSIAATPTAARSDLRFPKERLEARAPGLDCVGAIQTDVVIGPYLFKGRVEAGFRLPWDAPPKQWPHAGGHAACKVGGIYVD